MKTLQKFALGVCLFFSMLLFSAKSNAQVTAAFSPSSNTINCPTQAVYFSDNSTGNPTSWAWDFGDNTSSSVASPTHLFPKSGRYTVTLVVTNALNEMDTAKSTIVVLGPTVQYSKTIDTVCSDINVKFSSKATGGNPLTYTWNFGDGKSSSSITSTVSHTFKDASTYFVNLTVKDTNGCSISTDDTLTFGPLNPILTAAGPRTLAATRECTDKDGWTNYYNDNNTPSTIKDDILLLSLHKNNNNIGTVGDGTFQVKITATENAGTNQGILLNSPVISNPSGYYAMNRFWSVEPTTQPASPVGVKFYFNSQDVADINGSFPTHDALFEQLLFYKTKNGNPDPTSNLEGATGITSIFNGSEADETNWVYSYEGPGSHSAEFLVTDLSGGGGGGVTVDNQTLPVKLLSFAGKAENGNVKLNWSVASEINVERYEVQASTDGKTFTAIGNVQANGSTAATNNYTLTDAQLNGEKVKFYKLVTIDKDGKKSQSQVIKISLEAAANTISLYPVPANSYITVSSKTSINKTCTVEVYNYLGSKVMQVTQTAPGNSFKINTSALPTGRYRLIIFNSNDKIGDANFIIVR